MDRRDFVRDACSHIDTYRKLKVLADRELRHMVRLGMIRARTVLFVSGLSVKEMTLDGRDMLLMTVSYYADDKDVSLPPETGSFSFDLYVDRDLDPNLSGKSPVAS